MAVKAETTKIKGDKFGRPEVAIDEWLLQNLCKIQCTEKELCAVLEVCPETLFDYLKLKHNMTFSEYLEKYGGQGKVSLRRLQFRKAEEGSVPMLIWLGKQYLGQKDGDLALNDARACHTFTLKYDTKQALIDKAVSLAKEESNTVDVESQAVEVIDNSEILKPKTILRKAK